jgi:CobQ-like glutamine amidotransferase family enzyme
MLMQLPRSRGAAGGRLIELALRRSYGDDVRLPPIDDRVEELAHQAALRLVGSRR